MARLGGWLAWVDARRFRLHRVFPDHGAHQPGVRSAADSSGRHRDVYALVAAARCVWLRVVVRPHRPKTPLMISILWYSICNFAAGFAPSFAILAFFRIILGIGMGAEWPAGAALAMESWPARSRGLMSGLLQGAWGLGFLLASLVYWLLFVHIGWRGMLWVGILPALLCVYIRFFVKESEVWEENNRKRMEQSRLVQ